MSAPPEPGGRDAPGSHPAAGDVATLAARSPALAAARVLVRELAAHGLCRAVLCPGSRNTPLALAVAELPGVRRHVILDERSAAFFALGLARIDDRPPLLVCTSGTAAANFVPAVAEAFLSGVPLLVATADRPVEARGVHAAQTIDQTALFAGHVRWSLDFPAPDDAAPEPRWWRAMAARAWAAATLDSRGPVHLNLPFREPLLDAGFPEPVSEPGDAGVRVSGASKRLAPEQVRELAGRLRSAERGVIVASGRPAPAPAVARLAAALGWPVLADATSALRWGDHDRSHVVCGADILLRDDVLARAWRPDALLRLGTAAASKPLVRFLAGAQAPLDVLVAAEDWPDAEFGASMIVRAEAGALCHDLADVLQAAAPSDWLRGWLESDAGVLGAIDRAEREQREAPTLEEPLVARLALASVAGCLAAGDEGLLVVGNSMPIRDLESFGGGGPQRVRVLANRGANGIDGVVSTALGAAVAHGGAAVAVLGDLSFLHDIGALVTARAVGANLVVVVVDNDGGGIFRMLPQAAMRTGFDELLRTPQGIAADRAAAGLAASAVTVSSAALLESAIGRGLAAGGVHVVRVATDSARAVEIRRGLAASALEQRRIERSRCDADGSGAGAGQ